ncbi:hypothetical protein ACFC09_32570 [Streptomyces sp. NPDC056161]
MGATARLAVCAMPGRETRPIDAGLRRDGLTNDGRFWLLRLRSW